MPRTEEKRIVFKCDKCDKIITESEGGPNTFELNHFNLMLCNDCKIKCRDWIDRTLPKKGALSTLEKLVRD